MANIGHVFLDRDGTIIQDKHYLCDPGQVELLPGAARGLQKLAGHDCRLYLVSNQSGIGRGYFDEAACQLCQNRLAELLQEHGVRFVDMAHCPHAPEDGCDCRKPALGMWRQLAALHGLKPEQCAMIGDKRDDVAFARNAGMAASVLVLTGHGTQQAAEMGLPDIADRGCLALDAGEQPHWPDAVAKDLDAAVDWLLAL